jgi:L,D-transpeptidase ErfK/SrfK
MELHNVPRELRVPLSAWPDSSGIEAWIRITGDITAERYFTFMDSTVAACNLAGHPVDEYLFVHANPWILDTLRSHDYYNLAARGKTVTDPLSLVVFHRGDSLAVPDSLHRQRIRNLLRDVVVDVNIPAFQLLLLARGDTLLKAPVRVGRNARAFLAVIDKSKSLRTPIGDGYIVRIARSPWYVNPRTGKRYKGTTRDDGVWTRMPEIPWLEPEIDGRRQGSLIHPTTNRETLGKAYSNGCVGTREDDAWTIYYHAPIGTRVRFRYDLREVVNGDTLVYEDVYGIGQPDAP